MASDINFMNKCDVAIFMYDNERDHINFIRNNIDKFDRFIPKMLVQTKMDLIQQHSEHLIFQDDFAKELGGVKVFKQISVAATYAS